MTARALLRTWGIILSGTGIHSSVVPTALAVLVTVVWHGGTIETVGPFSLAAPLPVVIAVPALMAVACAISHVPPRTPVLIANSRTVAARAVSHLTVLAAGMLVAGLGDVLAAASTFPAAVRNLLLLTAAAVLVAGLAGPTYAWAPVLVLFGMGVLSNPSTEPWTLHSLLMSPTAEPRQLAVVAGGCLASVAVAALDPFHRAYLQGFAPASVQRRS